MTAREAKHQYQLTQWAGKISERAKSGPTTGRAESLPKQSETPTVYEQESPQGLVSAQRASVIPNGWTECRPAREERKVEQGITIEIGRSRVTVTAETDSALLAKVCRVLWEL